MIFAPFIENVEIGNNAKLNGGIITKNITMENSARISFSQVQTDMLFSTSSLTYEKAMYR